MSVCPICWFYVNEFRSVWTRRTVAFLPCCPACGRVRGRLWYWFMKFLGWRWL